ncbi:hypothetical protein JCM30471_19080 [Desulfuromonas carbonis]
MLIRFFSSLYLTLGLLLGLAAVSVFGTLQPGRDEGLGVARYDLFYQSIWFRLLLLLLALNLAVCTLRTIRRNLADRSRHLDLLRSERVFSSPLRYLLPRNTDMAQLAAALRASGYRVAVADGALVGERGRVGRWGSTLVHLSVLLIMAGAFCSQLGFVGTLNIYAGDQSDVYFDWERQQDLPLGFTFRLDQFEPRYYPIELQFAALDPASGQLLATYTCREGETVSLPKPGVTARVLKFIPEEEQLILEISRDGQSLGEYHARSGKLQGQPSFANRVDPGVVIRPLAWRDPILRQMHSEVSLLRAGTVVAKGIIEVNRPLVFEGVTIYQTGFSRDKFGFWAGGFQLSRDPGEPVVWFGCLTIVLGLLLAFLVPYRVIGVSRVADEVLLVALSGFRGEAGAARFDRLEQALADAGRAVSGKPGP